MADLNALYNDFNERIKLTSAKSKSLKTGRDSIRGLIRDKFSDNGRNKPKFRMQGSFSMKTAVNPIGDEEYDLDDGVYLQGYSNADEEGWPEPADTHKWVIDAVDGHTSSDSEDKTSCVRVRYKAGYHIDLPIYIIKNDICFLASKQNGWAESDPKAFKDWFMGYVTDYPYTHGEQLRRTVRYLKAWRDYCDVNIASITLTILATNHFESYSGRDDKAVRNTIQGIYNSLSASFSCRKPVAPKKELLEDYTLSEQKDVLDSLAHFVDIASQALDESDEKKASEIIREVYGERFPLGKASVSSSTYAITSSPGVIGNDGRSA